jgi:hypothetical protein
MQPTFKSKRKLFISVAWISGERFAVLEDISNVAIERLVEKGIDLKIAQETVDFVATQCLDPKQFPNAMLFLDDNGQEISFIDYMARCRKRN